MPKIPSRGKARTVTYKSSYGTTTCRFKPKKKSNAARRADSQLTEEQLYAKYYE